MWGALQGQAITMASQDTRRLSRSPLALPLPAQKSLTRSFSALTPLAYCSLGEERRPGPTKELQGLGLALAPPLLGPNLQKAGLTQLHRCDPGTPKGKAHLSASEDSPLHGDGCGQPAAPLAVAGGQLLWEGVVTGGTASPATGSSSETASLSTEGNAAVLSLHY
ncbi:unnamed protein product [Rangifer tarandus platyrhynchus]|uniref:Uncharacterized protein n=1 Tax=Rangifer tarandus platyrhynchus TaxID=3082113 RepID=A0AC59YAI5_RANTA